MSHGASYPLAADSANRALPMYARTIPNSYPDCHGESNGRPPKRKARPSYTGAMQRLIDPHGTWASPPPQHRPSFTGFLIWRDIEHKVSVLYPREWTVQPGEWTFLQSPAEAPHWATVTLRALRLPHPVEPGDLEALRDGTVSGVRSIPGVDLERVQADTVASLIDVEVEHTHDGPTSSTGEAGERRRRWLRVMFQNDVQFSISAEAPDGPSFEYWRPAFHSLMRMAIFADWTAEVTGRSWEPLDADPGEIAPDQKA